MIGVIDYGAGNLRSVCNSLEKLSIDSQVVKSPNDLDGISKMIFPGVGSFGDSSEQLKKQVRGLVRGSGPTSDTSTQTTSFFGF